jgi:hypothetical protein
MEEFIKKDSKAPNIEREVMGLVLYHFRSHVFDSSAEGCPLCLGVFR